MAANSNEAMREALKLCGSQMCKFCKELELARSMLNKRPLGVFCHPDKCTAYQAAHTALALPRRQCDVGTAGEQELRFEEHCNNYNEYCDGCPVPQIWHRGDMVGKCRLAWAQMPYEAANESEAK